MAINFGSDEEFIKNYELLKSSRKMGELYHCDKKSITTHAKKIGYDFSGNKELKITQYPIETIIADYEQIQSCKKVGEKYSCSGTAVRNYLINNGYTFNKEYTFTNVSDDEFIAMYETLKSADKMSKFYNCSTTTILNHAHKINYDPNSNKDYKLNDIEKQIIIDSYFDKTSTELAKEFSVSRGMITKIWHEANLLNKPYTLNSTTEIDLTGKTFGKWSVISKSKRRGKSGIIYWNCKCECGVEREVSGLALRNGTSLSCGAHSNISRGNEKIKQILLENNIPFITEKKFETCKDINFLPFDFYVDNSYLIEYDGIQHFQDTIFDYEYTHTHDLIKNQWCEKNNITLIRIPYTHFSKLCLNDLLISTSNFISVYADNKSDKIGETL